MQTVNERTFTFEPTVHTSLYLSLHTTQGSGSLKALSSIGSLHFWRPSTDGAVGGRHDSFHLSRSIANPTTATMKTVTADEIKRALKEVGLSGVNASMLSKCK